MEHPDSSAQPQAIPGSLIRSAREALLLSQDHLARAAGVSVSTIARMEKGNPVSAESLKAVCAVIGLDAVTLRRAASPDVTPPQEESNAAKAASPASGGTWRKRVSGTAAYVVPLLAVTFLLSVLAAEVGTQTSAAVLFRRNEQHERALLTVAVLVASGEVNQASVLYSSALPPDHPMRAWKPWKRMKPVTWYSCGPPSYVRRYMVRIFAGGVDDMARCRDEGLPMRMTRRDDVRTDFVLGPSRGRDISRLLALLTADPTVSIRTFASPLGDVPPEEAAWHDPRVDGYQGGMAEGKDWYMHLRLARNAS